MVNDFYLPFNSNTNVSRLVIPDYKTGPQPYLPSVTLWCPERAKNYVCKSILSVIITVDAMYWALIMCEALCYAFYRLFYCIFAINAYHRCFSALIWQVKNLKHNGAQVFRATKWQSQLLNWGSLTPELMLLLVKLWSKHALPLYFHVLHIPVYGKNSHLK